MTEHSLGPGTLRWNDTLYRVLLAPEATGGAMSIVDSLGGPGSGPPLHVHDAEDETFVMLSGEAEFLLAGDRMRKGPGETVFVPRGTEHTFRILGPRPSRHLVILTPGGFEGFFAEMAGRQCRIPEDMGAILEAAGRFALRFTGPPLAALAAE